jgi:PDZ domain-containing protein
MSQPVEVQRVSRRRVRFRSSYLLIPLALLVLVLGILELIPANVYVFLPGQALSVAPMIGVSGHPSRPKPGKLLLTDVSLYKANHLLEKIWGELQPGSDTVPASVVAGGLSESQYNQFNAQLMTDSAQAAEVAALYRVPGLHPRLNPLGPEIASVYPGLPSAKVLRVGDILVAANGVRVHAINDLLRVMKHVRPGSVVMLRLQRQGHQFVAPVRTVGSTNGVPTKGGKRALIGIGLSPLYILPIKVRVDPGNIGGPSAGLMFALGIIQRLVPQDIAHGCTIAGTGTIDFSGSVGPIGGAKQKVIAASNAGAKYFFVPDTPDNVGPAMTNRGSVTVVPVKSLDQALAYLKRVKPCRS